MGELGAIQEAGSGALDQETERLAKQLLNVHTPEQLAVKVAQHLISLKVLKDYHPAGKQLGEPRLGFKRTRSNTYRLTEADLQRIIESALTDFGIKVVNIALGDKGKFLSKKANDVRHEDNRVVTARAMVDWDAWQGSQNGRKIASRFAADRCDEYGVDEAVVRRWIRKHEAKKKAKHPDAPKNSFGPSADESRNTLS